MCLLFGFACGQLGKTYKALPTKKDGITIIKSMQPSDAPTIIDTIVDDAALHSDTRVFEKDVVFTKKNHGIPAMAKVALGIDDCSDIIPTSRDHLTSNAELDIGTIEPVNTS